VEGFMWGFWEKFSPIKILLLRYYQNKTNFSWAKRDSSKGSLENNVIPRRGRDKYTRFKIGGHVQMAKSDPEAQRSPRYRIANGWKNDCGS
jgi:hypothetical protein